MWTDHIVEEIHEIREKIIQECNYDWDQVIERSKKIEKEYQAQVIYKEDLIANKAINPIT